MARQHPAVLGQTDGPPRPRPAAPPGDSAVPRPAGRPGADPDATWSWWTGETREIPVPWEQRTAVRQRRPGGLRLPAPEDPSPATARMLGVCAWAALLGVVGLAVAGRAMVALFAGGTPPWYEPTVVGAGLTGMAMTAAAFLAVHHDRLPWLLLAGATIPLGLNLMATAAL